MSSRRWNATAADEVLGPDEVVRLVIRHAARLPLAMGLRIGTGEWQDTCELASQKG
jgi:hypothetical protein